MRNVGGIVAAPLLAAGILSAWAGEPAVPEKTEPARVYTNADLEALGPVPETPGDLTESFGEPADWEQVERFLEAEYGRIESHRRYELERALAEARLRRLGREGSRPHWVAPYNGIYGFWWLGSPFRYPRSREPIIGLPGGGIGRIPERPRHPRVESPPLRNDSARAPAPSAGEISRSIRQRIHTRGPVGKAASPPKGKKGR